VVKLVGTAIKVVVENVGRFINFIAQVITGTDNAADAWSKVGDWIQKLIDWIADFISDTSKLVSLVANGLTEAWKTAGDWLEKAAGWVDKQLESGGELVSTIGDNLAGAWKTVKGWVDGITDAVSNIWDMVNGLIDKVGNKLAGAFDKLKAAASNIPLIGGGYGVEGTAQGLDGANKHLKPLLGIAQKHGVQVTSGHRPGSTTSTGNTSMHATGNALDFAGSHEQMKSFAQEVARRFGDRIHSIIYSGAPGAQRSRGQPHQYGQPIRGNHWDRVHIGANRGQIQPVGNRQGSGYGIGGKQSVPDPRDNQEFKDAFKAATGKEFSDYKESSVTEAKRKLEREQQSDLKNEAQIQI